MSLFTTKTPSVPIAQAHRDRLAGHPCPLDLLTQRLGFVPNSLPADAKLLLKHALRAQFLNSLNAVE